MPGIFYTMGLNTTGFTGALNRATGALGSTMRGIGGLGSKLMSLTNAFTLAGQAMQGLKAAAAPFQLAAEMEKTEVGMNTIIKNLKVTKALMGELRTLAARTPLEMPQLSGGVRQMLGADWGLRDVMKDIEMFGDVAAGAGADVMDVVRIATQVKGKGKMSTLR